MFHSHGRILVLVGPKGAGKSHVGRLAERAFEARFVPVETLHLQARAEHGEGPAAYAAGQDAVFAAVESALDDDLVPVLESTGTAPDLHAWFERLGTLALVRLVAVRAPLSVCRERVLGRDASVHLPVSPERLDAINRIAASVQLPWDAEIDNGGPATEDRVVAALRAALR